MDEETNTMRSVCLPSVSFTLADAHLYGHLCPILHGKISEFEPLRNILVELKPLLNYVNTLERDVHGLSLLSP